MRKAGRHGHSPQSDYLGALLFVLLSPLIIVAIAGHVLAGLFLHIAIWCCWCARGRYVLLVYSDSPIWHGYVEENILPRLGKRAVVLNWSHRRRWRRTLAVVAFRHFGGYRAFNPMAVMFRPFRLARCLRFHEAFREFKQGKSEGLATMERELYDLVDGAAGTRIS